MCHLIRKTAYQVWKDPLNQIEIWLKWCEDLERLAQPETAWLPIFHLACNLEERIREP